MLRELLARAVLGREDQLRRREVLGGQRRTVLAHRREQAGEGGAGGLVVPRGDGGLELCVDRVQAVKQLVGDLVLPLFLDTDDHRGAPSVGGSVACFATPSAAGGGCALSLASSTSTSLWLESCESWRSMSSSPLPSAVRSSNVPASCNSPTASARAFMFSVLSTARCIAMPTSAISSPTPLAASEI